MMRRCAPVVLLGVVLGTSAVAQGRPGFSFAVLGHLRGDPTSGTIVNPLLPELVDDVRRAGVALVFLTGDMIWGDYNSERTDLVAVEREWEAFDAEIGRIGVPVHRVPGNHDINDLATRDLYFRRYPALPQAVTHERCLFLLLNSCWVPQDGDQRKSIGTHGVPIDARQIEFLTTALAATANHDHAFLFLQHLLWWDDDSEWWGRVHPRIAGTRVRAVFGGDYGPKKFSHRRRDGIDYLQACIETDPGVEMLRVNEGARLLSEQLDCWLLVHVNGPEVRTEVRTVGGLTAVAHTAERWRAVNELSPWQYAYYNTWATTRRKRLIAQGLVAGGFGVGVVTTAVVAWLWRRRRHPGH